MILPAAFISAFLFFALAGIHFYWAAGGEWGGDVAVPSTKSGTKLLAPSALACVMVGIGLSIFGLIELGRVGLLYHSDFSQFFVYGNYFIAAIFFLRAMGDFNYVGFFKKVKGTPFAKNDTAFYSPLCLFISITSLYIG